jgi:predicted DNA binding CopG/RHH family protein
MRARSQKPKQEELPPGLSPGEEAQWWDDHPDYWDNLDTEIEVIGPQQVRRTKPVNLRLPVDMIEALKQEAERRALPYQTLIRMWLKERLDTEDPTSKSR